MSMLAANRVTGRTAFGSAMPSLGNVKSFDLDDLESDDDDAPFGSASPGNKSESIGELEEAIEDETEPSPLKMPSPAPAPPRSTAAPSRPAPGLSGLSPLPDSPASLRSGSSRRPHRRRRRRPPRPPA